METPTGAHPFSEFCEYPHRDEVVHLGAGFSFLGAPELPRFLQAYSQSINNSTRSFYRG
jgi:hypothetical protein